MEIIFKRDLIVYEYPSTLLDNVMLPSIARILGVTATDKEKLLQFFKHLDDNYKHCVIHGHIHVTMMSRMKALLTLST